jgi:hypothetical protein
MTKWQLRQGVHSCDTTRSRRNLDETQTGAPLLVPYKLTMPLCLN